MSDGPQPAEPKSNYLPLILGGIIVFLLLRDQKQTQNDPPKDLVTTVKQTLPAIRSAYREAFLSAAAKIESGEIKTQEAWTKFIADNAGAKQREALDRVYKAIDESKIPASFEGKEKEIAELNRRIGEAW